MNNKKELKHSDKDKLVNMKGGGYMKQTPSIIKNVDELIKDIKPLKSPINKSNGDASNIKIVHIRKQDLPVDMHAELLTNKRKNMKLRKIR